MNPLASRHGRRLIENLACHAWQDMRISRSSESRAGDGSRQNGAAPGEVVKDCQIFWEVRALHDETVCSICVCRDAREPVILYCINTYKPSAGSRVPARSDHAF